MLIGVIMRLLSLLRPSSSYYYYSNNNSLINNIIISNTTIHMDDNGSIIEEMFTFPKLHAWEYLVYGSISLTCVLFAGLCSGLTLGLLSIDPIQLGVYKEVGTDAEKRYARRLEPILKRHHLLLATLLLWNALAMEALPLFLDRLVPEVLAILFSVSFLFIFGEVIPQSIISRFGLAIGGNLHWLVRILIMVAFPIAWPISKFLDYLLGHSHAVFYKRAELKELVNIHAEDEGGILNDDEIMVIRGALDLKEKQVQDITTPISRVFMLDVRRRLDEEAFDEILKMGHSRVPVYQNNNRQDVVGLLLVKNLIRVNFEDCLPLKDIELREMISVPVDMPLYDLLNQFQNTKNHMALVKRPKTRDEIEREEEEAEEHHGDMNGFKSDEIIVGIVTLEDVFEELLQEQILDETDDAQDAQRQMKVADLFQRVRVTMRSNPSLQRLSSSEEETSALV